MQLTKKQEEGLKVAVQRYKNREKCTVISGYAGSGKAQPIDTIIPTPEGNKKLGELKIGDYVFDRLGQPTKILGVYPQGLKEEYKVILSDGRESICAGDHLWSYYSSRGNLISKTAKEMLVDGIKNSCGFKYKIPNNKPAQYSHKNYKLDPYFVGVFLGDGRCKERYLTLSSETDEIPKIIGNIIEADPIKTTGNNYNWTFKWRNKTKTINWTAYHEGQRTIEREKPKTLDYFSEYADYFIQYSYDKDIPTEYKYGDIEQRLALIQGLMDTDGSINSADDGRYNIRYTSTSLKLINSLQEILFSLGYSSTIHADEREKYTNNICYNLSINIPNEEKYKFFRMKRKKDIALKAQTIKKRKDYSKISIINIIPLKEKTEMVCIYVDNLEHLYLTNNYIVTHNTTLIKFIIEALKIINPYLTDEKIVYTCFTGKACNVLMQKGLKNVKTLNKLLYESRPKKDGGYINTPVEDISEKIVIVDEVSMAPAQLMKLLFSYNAYVICCGDPFQLPPVSKDDDNHLLDHPHIFLDEIMRQAQDSEIIRLSMKIRRYQPIIPSDYGKEVLIFNKDNLTDGMLTWADQILVATNKTRTAINTTMRTLAGRGDKPESGDKVICLRNYWDDKNSNDDALVNGTIGQIITPSELTVDFPHWVKGLDHYSCPCIGGYFVDELGNKYNKMFNIDKQLFNTGENFLTWKDEYNLSAKKCKFLIPYEFTYGYAITTHRAQGSQWDKVLVIEEQFPHNREEHARWLYTACTRASSKLVLIRE